MALLPWSLSPITQTMAPSAATASRMWAPGLLPARTNYVSDVCFSPSGRFIAASSTSGNAAVYDFQAAMLDWDAVQTSMNEARSEFIQLDYPGTVCDDGMCDSYLQEWNTQRVRRRRRLIEQQRRRQQSGQLDDGARLDRAIGSACDRKRGRRMHGLRADRRSLNVDVDNAVTLRLLCEESLDYCMASPLWTDTFPSQFNDGNHDNDDVIAVGLLRGGDSLRRARQSHLMSVTTAAFRITDIGTSLALSWSSFMFGKKDSAASCNCRLLLRFIALPTSSLLLSHLPFFFSLFPPVFLLSQAVEPLRFPSLSMVRFSSPMPPAPPLSTYMTWPPPSQPRLPTWMPRLPGAPQSESAPTVE